MKKVCIIFLFFSMFFIFQHYFFRSSFIANAQQCVGSHTYVDYSCDYNSFSKRYTCNTNGSMVQSCGNGTCTTFGPVFCQGGRSCTVSSYGTGCSVYYPQPAPRPAPTQPSPSGGGVVEEETPVGGYFCGASGSCEYDPNGGSDYNSCQSSCGAVVQPGDPNAGVVTCGTETAPGEIFIKPGETKTWKTFAAPPGDRWAKLAGTSPGLVDVSYTAPADKFVVGTAANDSVQIRSYYVYDDLDRTWFFYQGPNKPPIVMSLSQEVVNRAVSLGYTQITDQSTAGAVAAAAVEKRVYLLTSDADGGHVWRAESGWSKGVIHHIPRSEYLVPFYNCASLMYTQNKKPFFSFVEGAAQPFCFGRGGAIRTLEKEGFEVRRFTTGNYLGMEADWGRSDWMQYDPELTPYKGNAVNEDMDMFAYAETSSNNGKGIGYVRMMVMEIPKEFLVNTDADKVHNLYPFVHADNNNDAFEPAKDENVSEPCTSNPGGIEIDVKLYEDPTPVPPRCDGFQVYQEIPSGSEFYQPVNKLRLGEKYLIRSRIQGESLFHSFYNQNFNDLDLNQTDVDGWQKDPGVSTFEIANCGSNCPTGATDSNVLKMAQQPSSTSVASTNYFDTSSNASNKVINVGFWARTQSGSASISVDVKRFGATITTPPYHKPNEPTDTAQLKFSDGFISSTTSITVSTTWKHFEGTTTFADTDNDSSKVKLVLRAPSNGTIIYYDDFSVTSWKKPIVDFRMVSANPLSIENIAYNQCTLSFPQPNPTPNPVYTTDPSNGVYYTTFDLGASNATGIQPGLHHIFARIETAPNKVYFGNPNAVINCNITDPKWDDSIAIDDPVNSACLKTIEIASCNENTPTAPTFISPGAVSSGLEAYVGTALQSNYVPHSSSITQMEVKRVSPGDYRLYLKASIPSGQAADVTEVRYDVYQMDNNGNAIGDVIDAASGSVTSNGTQTTFDITIVPTEAMTNQIRVEVYAVNGNSCVDTLGLESTPTIAKIRLMARSEGDIVDVPRSNLSLPSTDPDYFDCRENAAGAQSKGATALYSGPGTLFVRGNADAGETVGEYVNFANPPYAQSSSGLLSFFLPFNTNNSTTWKNQINKFELTLPPATSQESYVCLECNQKDNSTPNICVFSDKDVWSSYKTNSAFSDITFFVTQANIIFDSWWQSRGGLVASIGDMESLTPFLSGAVSFNCEDNPSYCQPYLNSRAMNIPGDYLTTDPSAGVPFTNSNILEARSFVTQRPTQAQAKTANTVAITEDFDYFRKLFKNDVQVYNTSANWGAQDFGNAEYTSEGDTDLFVLSTEDSATPNLDLNLLAPINVTAGTKIIVFVEGNLNITGPSDTSLTNVATGGFLMFIVKGDIVIDENIGHSLDNKVSRITPVLEGVFLANDDIIIESKGSTSTAGPADNKFVAEGSFIALNKTSDANNGIELPRHFDDNGDILQREKNSFSPVEMFIFRPDFIVNTPEILRRPGLTWKEAN